MHNNEEDPNTITSFLSRPTVFWDMDSVIADWAFGVASLFGVDLDTVRACEKKSDDDQLIKAVGIPTKTKFWKHIASAGESFWYNIPELEDGMACLRSMQNLPGIDVRILTKPTHDPASYKGKAMWVRKRFGNNSDILTLTREKWRLSLDNTVLIDDDHKNVDKFNEGHGTGLLMPRPFGIKDALAREVVLREALNLAESLSGRYMQLHG